MCLPAFGRQCQRYNPRKSFKDNCQSSWSFTLKSVKRFLKIYISDMIGLDTDKALHRVLLQTLVTYGIWVMPLGRMKTNLPLPKALTSVLPSFYFISAKEYHSVWVHRQISGYPVLLAALSSDLSLPDQWRKDWLLSPNPSKTETSNILPLPKQTLNLY